ncbi:transmembrane protein [Rhynchospora pubera]|uniref:Transmembrane protein n=1 Tax=Rhynchospora pubera TaxID=906938 RepID=A0AAV8CEV6_9POAL|nr:transmembrane protein [Rhynchospora pubera]
MRVVSPLSVSASAVSWDARKRNWVPKTKKTRRDPSSSSPLRLSLMRRSCVSVSRVVPFAKKPEGKSDYKVSQSQSLRQGVLWATEAVYIVWLFLLPFAPGDPVWAITPTTIHQLLGLSLNFFFILPFFNSVGIHFIQAPLLHPVSQTFLPRQLTTAYHKYSNSIHALQVAEGLFNFVIAWTLMFAPLLFTDCKRDRYKGSLDLLWAFQMFLTNTFLIPYMAIRLNEEDPDQTPPKLSKLGSVMVQGAPLVGLIGGLVCLLSLIWAFFGRGYEQFGGITERTQYLFSYLGSERLAYAFIWDIVLYSIFQPWLIAENIENVKRDDAGYVNWFKFIPVVGLVFYLLNLDVRDTDS